MLLAANGLTFWQELQIAFSDIGIVPAILLILGTIFIIVEIFEPGRNNLSSCRYGGEIVHEQARLAYNTVFRNVTVRIYRGISCVFDNAAFDKERQTFAQRTRAEFYGGTRGYNGRYRRLYSVVGQSRQS